MGKAGPMSATIGFLHTSPVHVATFDSLVANWQETVTATHIVDEELLALAQSIGTTHPTVVERVATALSKLVHEGADVVVCTCSTIGATAELAEGAVVPVLRVDRPMAAAAVASGQRIAVVAALESTLAPTVDLLREESARVGRAPVINMMPCLSSWDRWAAGDIGGYHRAIAEHVNALDESFDVVVLAQASMLGALASIDERPERVVLTSPLSAVHAAMAIVADLPR